MPDRRRTDNAVLGLGVAGALRDISAAQTIPELN